MGGGWAIYRIAGEDVVLGGSWPDLEPFRRRTASAPAARSRPGAPFRDLRYHGPATFGTDASLLTCTQGDEGYLLRAAPGASLWVAGDGASVTQLEAGEAGKGEVSAELLCGPAFLLALALRGTYALHASAVRFGKRVVAFVGESGAGKSTLAALLAAPGLGCERVADDILPFAVVAGVSVAHPAYPQLKLPPDEQWAAAEPESLPLQAVYRLAPPAGDAGCPRSRIEPLTGAAALAVLTAHSVAAALFGPELLRQHFDALAAASRALRVGEMRYPRRLDAAADVAARLREDLDG